MKQIVLFGLKFLKYLRRRIFEPIRSFLAAQVLLITDPLPARLVGLFYRSLMPFSSPVKDHCPWVALKSIPWLEAYLRSDMSIFEYGSGGSTLFFAKRVKRVVSVESDSKWYREVMQALQDEGLDNYEYHLMEPEKIRDEDTPVYDCHSYSSKRTRGLLFKKYVDVIKSYPDGMFDLVFIDGRARASCMFHAIAKVRSGGYLVLDNSDRPGYTDAMRLLDKFSRKDFFGLGPYATDPWQTTVWKIE